MKKILLPLCIYILISCTSRKDNNSTPENNVPEALQDNKEGKLVSFSKRGPDDLVEELYEEKVKSTPALQAIEKMIHKLNDAENDSLEVYNDFKAKNQQYFGSATAHLNSIKDSLLKKEIEAVIEKNLFAHNNKIAGLNDLASALNNISGSVRDRHTILMILISLGMMKEYQDKNNPSPGPIESVINSYNNLLKKMDSVISQKK